MARCTHRPPISIDRVETAIAALLAVQSLLAGRDEGSLSLVSSEHLYALLGLIVAELEAAAAADAA